MSSLRAAGPLSMGVLFESWGSVARAPPLEWRQVRGPLGAAWLELSRAGFTWTRPHMWRSAEGAEINLTQQSPAFVKQVMMQAWDGMLQTKAAGRIAARGLGPDLGRLAVEGVRRILRSSRFSASEKTLGLACFTRAYWTHDVLIQMGYSPGAQCPLCPATDCLHHRLWQCPAVAGLRKAAVADLDLRWAVHRGPDPLVDHGWFQHPVLRAAGSVGDVAYIVEVLGVDGEWVDYDLAGGPVALHGRLFTDGSCFPSSYFGLARAGWAIVMVDAAGTPILRVLGAVWGGPAADLPGGRVGSSAGGSGVPFGQGHLVGRL